MTFIVIPGPLSTESIEDAARRYLSQNQGVKEGDVLAYGPNGYASMNDPDTFAFKVIIDKNGKLDIELLSVGFPSNNENNNNMTNGNSSNSSNGMHGGRKRHRKQTKTRKTARKTSRRRGKSGKRVGKSNKKSRSVSVSRKRHATRRRR